MSLKAVIGRFDFLVERQLSGLLSNVQIRPTSGILGELPIMLEKGARPRFKKFELGHHIGDEAHRFEVAYDSSFNELYYDFSPIEFVCSVNSPELELQLGHAGQSWLVQVLMDVASGTATMTHQETAAMVKLREESEHE